jgi:DNA-directed RNA polymerase subunit RPC12/RpoP
MMDTITFKCPNCGGGLVFNPETQTYKCEFCLSDFSLGDLETQDVKNNQDTASTAAKDQEAVLYTCPSCGAEIVTDQTTAASICYYCHNPVVLQGRLTGRYQPDYVVPFSINRKQAEEIFAQWIRRKRYAPSDFYSKKQIDSMTGVYFPYWLYSCTVEGKMEAEGTRLRMWDAGNLRYTEKKIYHISRDGQMKIHHMARNALKKANAKLSFGVLPFQTEGIKPFQMGYLTGFFAEKRDIGQEQICPEAEREVKEFAAASLKNSAEGYSGLNIRHQETNIQDPVWHYGLFPVWTLTYKGPRDGKIYYFALNGQTGKVCGEIPVDGKKLLVLFLSVFLPLLALLLTGGYFL